jgi:hypothetical protein
MAQQQRRIIGRAKLRYIGTEVAIIAKAVDLPSGSPFYIVDGPRPFGVWPEELQDLRYCQPLEN